MLIIVFCIYKNHKLVAKKVFMSQTFHRRNLPHLYDTEGRYFITYRLKNSIPQKMIKEIHETYSKNEKDKLAYLKFSRMIDKYENALSSGEYGIDYLKNVKVALACKNTLHYPDGKDYELICYSIMPNHIHLIFELLKGNKGISKIMQSIKRLSALESNKILNRSGSFWHAESYDRQIRDDVELYYFIKYVLLNPVKSGYVKNWYDWENTYCHPSYIVL